MKRIRLHKSTLSNEDLTAIAEQTLTNGGYKGPRIGDTMSDGTIYAGISPETGKPIYTTPADAPDFITFDMEQAYVAGLRTHGRTDWRMPSKGELQVLFKNRAAIGGFNTRRSPFMSCIYWSGTSDRGTAAWCQRLS